MKYPQEMLRALRAVLAARRELASVLFDPKFKDDPVIHNVYRELQKAEDRILNELKSDDHGTDQTS